MRQTFLIVSFLFLACGNSTESESNECSFPKAYTATYDKLDGRCGTFETESFPSELEPSWFPVALNLEDCEQTVACSEGVIQGSSFCMRTTETSFGTLDGTLVFDTHTGSGTLELDITATNYHRTDSCTSTYEVTYTE